MRLHNTSLGVIHQGLCIEIKTMEITVKLFATLRKGRFDSKNFNIAEGTTIYEILNDLKIQSEDAAIVFLNGKHAELDQILSDGDTISIFPPIGGG